MFFLPTYTEYIFDLTAMTSFITSPPHSSCPKPSYFCHCKADGPWGSCLCHTAMSILACLCTHLLSRCLRSACLCLYRSARIFARILLSDDCRRIIHQYLAVLEDRHACVYELVQRQLCFAHMYACHIVSKDYESVKRWT